MLLSRQQIGSEKKFVIGGILVFIFYQFRFLCDCKFVVWVKWPLIVRQISREVKRRGQHRRAGTPGGVIQT